MMKLFLLLIFVFATATIRAEDKVEAHFRKSGKELKTDGKLSDLRVSNRLYFLKGSFLKDIYNKVPFDIDFDKPIEK